MAYRDCRVVAEMDFAPGTVLHLTGWSHVSADKKTGQDRPTLFVYQDRSGDESPNLRRPGS